jgi:hypothetical protein
MRKTRSRQLRAKQAVRAKSPRIEPTKLEKLALEIASLYATFDEFEKIERVARDRGATYPDAAKEKHDLYVLSATAALASDRASRRIEAIGRHILDAEPETAIDALIKLIAYNSEVDGGEDWVAAVLEAPNAEERSRIIGKAEHEHKRFAEVRRSIIRGFEAGLGVTARSLGLKSHFESGPDLPELIAEGRSEAKRLLGEAA